MITLNPGSYKAAGEFMAGELAYDEESDAVYLRVDTNTHRPDAFRMIFARVMEPNASRDAMQTKWKPCFGTLKRFGALRQMSTVFITDSMESLT